MAAAAYASKTKLYAEGLELLPSSAHRDCNICLQPLDPSPSPIVPDTITSPTGPGPGHDQTETQTQTSLNLSIIYHTHAAVKIKACSHVFGISCLQVWLMRNGTCPMCRKYLAPRSTADELIDDLEFRYPDPSYAAVAVVGRWLREEKEGRTEDEFVSLLPAILDYVWVRAREEHLLIEDGEIGPEDDDASEYEGPSFQNDGQREEEGDLEGTEFEVKLKFSNDEIEGVEDNGENWTILDSHGVQFWDSGLEDKPDTDREVGAPDAKATVMLCEHLHPRYAGDFGEDRTGKRR